VYNWASSDGEKVAVGKLFPGIFIVIAVGALAAVGIILSNKKPIAPEAQRPAPTSGPVVASPVAPPAPSPSIAFDVSGPARIIDGDTIDVAGTRIRLHGIDAPETKQTCDLNGTPYRCGDRATEALRGLIAGHPVMCKETARDRWRRMVARCLVEGSDVGKQLVEQGWAIAYRKYSKDYVSAELEASTAKRGMWAGSFVPPDQWRAQKLRESFDVGQ
jgi:endonuclease YncB( thermonuclease family)